MKIKFELEEKTRAGKLYLIVNFAGGDADTEHPEEIEFEKIPYLDYKSHIEEISKTIEQYNILKEILDVNSVKHLESYKEVEAEYGKEMALLYDNTPNDPQSDYQFKCYLDSMELIGYDEKGNKYK